MMNIRMLKAYNVHTPHTQQSTHLWHLLLSHSANRKWNAIDVSYEKLIYVPQTKPSVLTLHMQGNIHFLL